MKLLIMSDIHGNMTALKSVLNDAKKRNDISAYIMLGDIIDYGQHSNEVTDILRSLSLPILCNIIGNHENAVIHSDFTRFSSERGIISAKYTQSILSQSAWDYIKNTMHQSGKYVFTIGNKKCLAVHGSLSDEYWGSITTDTPQDEYESYDCVFSGHSHIPHFFEKYVSSDNPKTRNKKKIIFINPGSVGQPRNLNNMAQYAVFDTETEAVEMCKTVYDIKSEQSSFTGQTDYFYMERLEYGI